jgi:hypothetical protein
MGIPQVPDRIKEAPAAVLRAVFAGAGQLLLAAEKIRARAMEQAAAIQRATAAAGKAARERAGVGAGGAGSGGGGAGGGGAGAPPVAAAAAPGTAAAPAGAAGNGIAPTATANLPAKKPASTVQQASEVPPIPGYGELSVASLRARLRVLDEGTVAAMLAYEKAHARREPVIAMFERRLAKLRGQAG